MICCYDLPQVLRVFKRYQCLLIPKLQLPKYFIFQEALMPSNIQITIGDLEEVGFAFITLDLGIVFIRNIKLNQLHDT